MICSNIKWLNKKFSAHTYLMRMLKLLQIVLLLCFSLNSNGGQKGVDDFDSREFRDYLDKNVLANHWNEFVTKVQWKGSKAPNAGELKEVMKKLKEKKNDDILKQQTYRELKTKLDRGATPLDVLKDDLFQHFVVDMKYMPELMSVLESHSAFENLYHKIRTGYQQYHCEQRDRFALSSDSPPDKPPVAPEFKPTNMIDLSAAALPVDDIAVHLKEVPPVTIPAELMPPPQAVGFGYGQQQWNSSQSGQPPLQTNATRGDYGYSQQTGGASYAQQWHSSQTGQSSYPPLGYPLHSGQPQQGYPPYPGQPQPGYPPHPGQLQLGYGYPPQAQGPFAAQMPKPLTQFQPGYNLARDTTAKEKYTRRKEDEMKDDLAMWNDFSAGGEESLSSLRDKLKGKTAAFVKKLRLKDVNWQLISMAWLPLNSDGYLIDLWKENNEARIQYLSDTMIKSLTYDADFLMLLYDLLAKTTPTKTNRQVVMFDKVQKLIASAGVDTDRLKEIIDKEFKPDSVYINISDEIFDFIKKKKELINITVSEIERRYLEKRLKVDLVSGLGNLRDSDGFSSSDEEVNQGLSFSDLITKLNLAANDLWKKNGRNGTAEKASHQMMMRFITSITAHYQAARKESSRPTTNQQVTDLIKQLQQTTINPEEAEWSSSDDEESLQGNSADFSGFISAIRKVLSLEGTERQKVSFAILTVGVIVPDDSSIERKAEPDLAFYSGPIHAGSRPPQAKSSRSRTRTPSPTREILSNDDIIFIAQDIGTWGFKFSSRKQDCGLKELAESQELKKFQRTLLKDGVRAAGLEPVCKQDTDYNYAIFLKFINQHPDKSRIFEEYEKHLEDFDSDLTSYNRVHEAFSRYKETR